MSTEALLALGYAAFLLAAATGLDLLARHSHRRSTRYRTAGFSFRPDLDLWECPEGQHLHRVETDHQRRLVRYRASPQICNACPVKADCTDSDRGREIAQSLDPWPHSEAGRFHRGVCVVLVALAALISAIALVRSDGTADLLALSAVLGISIAVTGRLLTPASRSRRFAPAAVRLHSRPLPGQRLERVKCRTVRAPFRRPPGSPFSSISRIWDGAGA